MTCQQSTIRLAKSSPYRQWQHAAIVYRGSTVVGMASNTRNLHAEVRALNKVKNKKNLTVLSVRVNRLGQLRMAKPCEDCRRFLLQHGVKTVLYSTDDGRIIRE